MFMNELKKPGLIFLCCFLFMFSHAQNIKWLLGTWQGAGSSENNVQFIRTITVDSVDGNSFSGIQTSQIKNKTRFKIVTALLGSVDNAEIHVSNGTVIYKKDPPNGQWTDCSACLPETKISIALDRIVLTSHITGCQKECNNVSVYYKMLCDYDTVTQRYLINRFGTASDIANFKACKNEKPVVEEIESADTVTDEIQHIDTVAEITPAIIPAAVPVINDTVTASTSKALETRENVVLETYHIKSHDILIELFDNAQIDGDRVSVYHNDSLIVNNKTLLREPITIRIKADAANRMQEFIMVAENLGSIPPNTALMRVTVGEQVYKLSVKTDMKTNAKIVFFYDGN
jgi:hypothetical protein